MNLVSDHFLRLLNVFLIKKRVIRGNTDDSPSGGRCHRILDLVLAQLLFTVMSLHINFLAVDHSEVASDKRKFCRSIFAICAKALLNADN